MINPPEPATAKINVACKKCDHSADIVLPVERKRDTDKLICSKCGAKGWDLVIEYLDIPDNR